MKIEMDKEILAEAMMRIMEDSFIKVFTTLQQRGEITEELWSDYLDFCKVARKTFENYGVSFSLDLVYAKLPENKWWPIYLRHITELDKKEKEKTSAEIFSALRKNTLFQDLCKKIKTKDRSTLH